MKGNYATRRALRRGYSTQRTVFKMFVPLCFSEMSQWRQRRNDVYGRMRTIAANLTDSEIDGLAAYYRA